MKTAREFAKQFQRPDIIGQRCIGGADIEARDREVRAAVLREAEKIARSYTDGIASKVAVSVAQGIGDRLAEMADRAERGP